MVNKDIIKNILIFRTEHIGDYIVSLPAIKSLRDSFPNAKIDIVVGPWNEGLAKVTPYIDKIIIFDNPFAKRKMSYWDLFKISLTKFTRILGFIKKIRANKYDLLVVLSDRKFNKLFSFFIRAKNKISGRKLNDNLDQVARWLEVIKEINHPIVAQKPDLRCSKKDVNKVKNLLKENNVGENFIVVHAVTLSDNKNWPLSNWEKALNMISEKNKGFKFLLIGDKEDKEKVDNLAKKIGKEKVVNLCGDLSLTQLFILMKKSKLFLGSCSGPLFIANLAGTPIVGLYSIESDKSWEMPGKKVISLRENNINEVPLEYVIKSTEHLLKSEK